MKRVDTKENDYAVSQLKAYRKKLGLTQSELAAIVGMDGKQKIADYETYRAKVPAGVILQVQKMVSRKPRKSGTLAEVEA